MSAHYITLADVDQTSIKITVKYYDKTEEGKFDKYPTATNIKQMVTNGIDITISEFLTYFLFHRLRVNKPGWRNYDAIGAHINTALNYLNGWIEFNGDSISLSTDIDKKQPKDITEHIGESIGLSLVNSLHGLTAADWTKIPEDNKISTFDYQIASDGERIIQLEAKGSASFDNTEKTTSVSAHKKSIHNKKENISNTAGYNYPANIRYGTITVVGTDKKTPAKCLFVDPEASEIGDPKRIKIIKRMQYLKKWISLISPTSQFSAALNTRANDLLYMKDPYSLNNVPLSKGDGTKFSYEPRYRHHNEYSSFFSSKSQIADGDTGGVVIRLDENNIGFIGINQKLVEIAANQNFNELIEYKTKSMSSYNKINCIISKKRLNTLLLPENVVNSIKRGYKKRDYIAYEGTGENNKVAHHTFDVTGRMFNNDCGLTFGILPIKNIDV